MIFKKWFSRQRKKLSQQTSDDNELAAYITIGFSTKNEPFVKCAFHEEYKNEIAQLIALLHAGLLNSHVLVALQQCCENDEEFEEIGKIILAYINEYAKSQEKVQENAPVVDPCCVFKHSDRNEFKG